MKNLQKIRLEKGFSQSQLSQAARVPLKTLQKYESGERDINHCKIITAYRLSIVLECNIEDLIEKGDH